MSKTMLRLTIALFAMMSLFMFTGAQTGPKPLTPVEKDSEPGVRRARDDYVITWQDPAFEAMIRQGLNKPLDSIWRSDLDAVTCLHLIGNGRVHINSPYALDNTEWGTPDETFGRGQVRSLNDLAHFYNLTELYVMQQELSDISGISRVRNLTRANLGRNRIEDVSPLAALTKLEYLSIWGNQIEDASPLLGLESLRDLYISENPLTNGEMLQEMDLRTLHMRN